MGRRRPRGREVHGILLLDKPAGMTSNAALQEVKHLLFAQKAGHTGSLDPLATGLLPICLGRATRVSGFLLDADKRYRLTCRLGVATTTGDAEGEVTETRPVPPLSATAVKALLRSDFSGVIRQIPPMYSALKHQGKRLYTLARQGLEVEREAREVTIHAIELLALRDAELTLAVHCSKGTYIRTLAEDIGKALGPGAHVTALRRTAVTPFEDPRMHDLEELRELKQTDTAALDALLLPPDAALQTYPRVVLTADMVFYLRQGQPVQVPKAPADGWVRLYHAEAFIGMGAVQDDGKIAPRRLFGTQRKQKQSGGKDARRE